MNNHNLPAFPLDAKSWQERVGKGLSQAEVDKIVSGVSKREYFAAMAMQGIMSNPSCIPIEQVHFSNIAEDSIRAADELLKQLKTK